MTGYEDRCFYMTELYCAHPRYSNQSFPPVRCPRIADAVQAGLKTGLPFDVHMASGEIVWVWEQRP